MGPTIIVVTSDVVDHEDLKEFIYSEGGEDDPNAIYHGWIAGPTHCVYMKWYSENDDDPETKDRVIELLGAPPNGYLLLDLIRGPNTQRVAWRLIRHFCERWHPCVLRSTMPLHLADEGKLVWTMDEVAEFFRTHHRLPN